MKKLFIALAVVLLITSTSHAWDMSRPLYHAFVDSNEFVILEVDSADIAGAKLHVDTTYFPNKTGYPFGWCDYLQIKYGVSAIDGTPYPEGAGESDSGHSALFAVAVDSAHIGVTVQTSRDAVYWSTVFKDTTLRATASQRSTRSAMLDLQAMQIADTLVGGRFRFLFEVFRDVDSTETDAYNITDSIWLDLCELWGFGYK